MYISDPMTEPNEKQEGWVRDEFGTGFSSHHNAQNFVYLRSDAWVSATDRAQGSHRSYAVTPDHAEPPIIATCPVGCDILVNVAGSHVM